MVREDVMYNNEDVLEDVIHVMTSNAGVTYYEVDKIVEPNALPEITITIKLIAKKERH